MVAYKNNPGKDKDYQKQDYRLAASITGIQYNPSYNKRISADSLDEVVQPSEVKELYKKRIEPGSRMNNDLSQPIWFEEILKRLANDNAKKSEKERPPKNSYYVNLN